VSAKKIVGKRAQMWECKASGKGRGKDLALSMKGGLISLGEEVVGGHHQWIPFFGEEKTEGKNALKNFRACCDGN